jgi:hypothetical protein
MTIESRLAILESEISAIRAELAEAEAKARLARMEVETKLKEMAGGYRFTYGKVNCYLSKYENDIWEVEGRMNVWVPGVVYFATKEAALAARDAIGCDKLDLLLGV